MLFHSSDLDEVLDLATRVVVIEPRHGDPASAERDPRGDRRPRCWPAPRPVRRCAVGWSGRARSRRARVLAAGLELAGLRRGRRARRALVGRLRLVVRHHAPRPWSAPCRSSSSGSGSPSRFRAGAFNIGGEGQFYAGAIAATWLGLHAGSLPRAAGHRRWCCAVRVLAGALWVAVPVLLRVRYGVLEVISTLLLNFVAEATTSLDGAGAAPGEPGDLSPERCHRGGRPAAAAARHPTARRHPDRARRRGRAATSLHPHACGGSSFARWD